MLVAPTAAFPAPVPLVTSVINCRFQLGSYTTHRTDPVEALGARESGDCGLYLARCLEPQQPLPFAFLVAVQLLQFSVLVVGGLLELDQRVKES
ncbi:hypothetical protein [Streptomyces caniscabiei]|uniref:hypothetical protein n=1 Tax=Streptomyces caniscabiei TaxID=2746961 RepID=UPI00117E562C|nr:hypothetical protein [Streptomyces caniscabiei]